MEIIIMNWKIWYNLPNNKSFAFISRSGTSSLGLMSLKTFYPERLQFAPANVRCGIAHRLNDYEIGKELPNGCLVMVRNPIERFVSLLNRFSISIDKAICWLYWFYDFGDRPKNTDRADLEFSKLVEVYHLAPLSYFIQDFNKVYPVIFPDFQKAANYLGLNYNIEHINISEKKINLTLEQESLIRKIYNKDIELWESLNA
jgi:hypothetical protein